MNSPYSEMKSKPHTVKSLQELSGVNVEQMDNSELVKISFNIPDDVKQGYFFSGSSEYDLILMNGKASVTITREDLIEDSAKVALF